MTLQQFLDKYNGKFVEYHSYNPAAKFQCTDLANQYIVECLGLEAIIGTNAQDFPSKAVGFEIILNTPTGIPSPGDLVIFKSADGVGHISIFVSGNASLFTSFDQNYPTGSPCKLVSHNYRNVISWLHPKENMPVLYKGLDLTNQESMKVAVDIWSAVKDGQYIHTQDLVDRFGVGDIEGLAKLLQGKDSRITDLTNQLGTAQAEVKNKQEIIERLQGEIAKKDDDVETLMSRLDQCANTVAQLGKDKGLLAIENEQLKVQIETLKQGQQQGTYTITIADLFKLIWNQKITIERK